MLSPYKIKNILRGKNQQTLPTNDFRIIDSYAIYEEDDSKKANERNLDFLCYEIESMNPETGEVLHYYKALKFARVIRLPKSAKQSKSFMDQQQQILSSVYGSGINLVTIIANIIKPVPLGLLFLYGVQGVGETIEAAKEQAHLDFIGLTREMQGTYKVLELRNINEQETEWLREKMYNMDYMTMVRGIPKANKSGVDVGNKGIGGNNLNPDSQGTLEEFIIGMADYEYVVQVLSSPVYLSTLREWQAQTEQHMTDFNSQLQGTQALSFNISVPMMYMANQSSSEGWSKAYTDADSVTNTIGESFSTGYGESVSETLSKSYSESLGLNRSTSVSDSFSHSQSVTEGITSGQTFGQSVGQNVSSSVNSGENINISHGQSLNQSQSSNFTQSEGVSTGQSMNETFSESVNSSHSVGTNESFSNSFTESIGETNTSSMSQTATHGNTSSVGESWSNGESLGITSSESYGKNYSSSEGFNNSFGFNESQGGSYSSGENSGGSITPFGLGGNWGSSSSSGTSWNSGVNMSFGSNQTVSEGVTSSTSNGLTNSFSSSHGTNISNSESSSLSNGISQSESLSHTQSNGYSNSYGSNESFSVGNGQSHGQSYGLSESITNSQSVSNGISNGWGESLSESKGLSYGQGYSEGASYSNNYSQSMSNSSSISEGITTGKSIGQTQGESYTKGVSEGTSQGYSQSTNVSQGTSTSQSKGQSRSVSNGTTGAFVNGASSSMGFGPSIGFNKSYQWLDQEVKDILELLEFSNERIKKSLRGEGAFYTYVYIACPSRDALAAAQSVAKATWQNEFAMVSPLQVLKLSDEEQKHLLYHFSAFSIDVTREDISGAMQYKYCTILLPHEYVAYTHLPRVSEGGVFADVNDIPKFAVPSGLKGEIYMGTILSAERYTVLNGYRTPHDFRIDESELMHGFFTGASRSGKTVAAMRFVAELANVRRKDTGKRLRIVCMDPKQDWRTLARFVDPDRFRFYSLGNPSFRPVYINPFKIPRGVEPQTWIDGVIDIYCRAYGLLERGKQMMGETIYALYEEAGVFAARNRVDWKEQVPERSKQVTFPAVYKRMSMIKASLEDPSNPKGRAGNDTRDAYARLIDRLQCFNREFSVETKLFGSSAGLGIDELIGNDDVTILESSGLEKTFKNFIFGVITSGFYKFAKAHEGGYLARDQYETVLVIEEANEVLIGNDCAGSGAGSSMGMTVSGQSEFEEILDQSAGYGLFILAITQKIADMPKSIIANSGLVFAGRLKTPDDITVVVRSIAREERYDDRDIVKWFPRMATGMFVCQRSRTFDFKDAEPILVQIARLNAVPPTNLEIDEILTMQQAILAQRRYAS